MNPMSPPERLIVALDVPNLNLACKLARLFNSVKTFKVGSQLFSSSGPEAVKALQVMGKNVFLDLKFNDIPNTVSKATEAVVAMGVDMFTVHISSGLKTLKAAVEAAKNRSSELGIPKPIILGITLLTSIDEATFQRDFASQRSMAEQVGYMAKLAQQAGLDGVVASAKEANMVRSLCGEDFIIATPGIRIVEKAEGGRQKAEGGGRKADDQQRIMTPFEAVKAGANYIIVGRPIYQAADPQKAMEEIVAEIDEAMRR